MSQTTPPCTCPVCSGEISANQAKAWCLGQQRPLPEDTTERIDLGKGFYLAPTNSPERFFLQREDGDKYPSYHGIFDRHQIACLKAFAAAPAPTQRPVRSAALEDALRIANSYSIYAQLEEDDDDNQPGTVEHERKIATQLSEALLQLNAQLETSAASFKATKPVLSSLNGDKSTKEPLERLSAHPQPAQWADISTAPKDKTRILIYCPDPNEQDGVGYVDDRGRTYCVNNGDYIDGGYGWDYEVHATHWMPLPAAPQTDKAGE